ncbi:MAG: hypothetical protein IJ325_06990 [Clostridia bacterium]|nr:hypothetical protein [Clostridia bacterium]
MELTKEEELLCARAAELAENSSYMVSATPFFTPRERLAVHDFLCRSGQMANCFWWGGYPGAERACGIFVPEWYLPEEVPAVSGGYAGAFDEERDRFFARLLEENPSLAEEIPLRALSVRGSGFASLSHRDFMGGILALGIERDVIGDIVVRFAAEEASSSQAVVFAAAKICSYLEESLTQIGRDAVVTERITHPAGEELPRRFESIAVTVSSPRLDGIVKAITGMSREDAAEFVRRGLAELNYHPAPVDKTVCPGDTLSLRGHGKYRIDTTDTETRRGRIRVTGRKYI